MHCINKQINQRISIPIPTLFKNLKTTLLMLKKAVQELYPTAPDLGDPAGYSYFGKTSPRGIYEADILIRKIDSMLDGLHCFQWTYCNRNSKKKQMKLLSSI